MARKPATIIPQPADDSLPALPVLTEAANQLAVLHTQQEATVRAVAAQLGYQLPADCTDPDLIQRDIAANMRRSVEACLEVGRGLRVLKEACEHGQFLPRLEVLGLDHSVAKRFMQAALKFANGATSHHLTKAIGTQSKLFEMLVLDDEQIEELELTGQTGELTLDDIATMSVKELRGALRETRAQVEDKERVLADKSARMDQLTEELVRTKRRVNAATPVDIGEEIRREAGEAAFEIEALVRGKLHATLKALIDHGDDNGLDHDDFMAGLLCQVEKSLRQLRGEFSIKEVPDGEEEPAWMRTDLDAEMAASPLAVEH